MLYLIVLSLVLFTLFASWARRRGFIFTWRRKTPAEVLINRIEQHLAAQEWSEGERLWQRLSESDRDLSQAKLVRIKLFRQAARLEEALSLADSISKDDPQALSIEKERGHIYLALGEAKKALDSFERCRPLLRDEADLCAVATGHYMLANYPQALATIRPRLKSSTSGTLAALAGDCRHALGDIEEALALYESALSKGGDRSRLLSRMGHCHRKLCDWDKAESCFRTILSEQPADVNAALNLGTALEAQEQHLSALQVYQGELIWEQCDVRILARAGICAVHAERYAFAETYLNAAHMAGHASATSYAYLGYAVERQRKWRDAEGIYLELTQQHRECLAGFRGLAWLYGVGLSHSLDAITGVASARRCLELQEDEISWELLSACEARAGNFTGAHQIQESLTQSPQDRETLLRRRRAMRALRQGLPLDENLVARGMVA